MTKTKKCLIALMAVLCCFFAVASCAFPGGGQSEETTSNEEYIVYFIVDGQIYHAEKTGGNDMITMPVAPVKSGYTFDGWYFDEGTWSQSFTTLTYLAKALDQNVSVYAKFLADENEETSSEKESDPTDKPDTPVEKKDYDMSNVVFEDASFVYDGQPHFIYATNLPEGVTVVYKNNGNIQVGTYNVTAEFSGDS
ncbi:MAG: InlB B-repeat-containing protein, partial [Clostridia bacterium]|nr:InlB B-repeat-containing protein [Clostridia bacterium]